MPTRQPIPGLTFALVGVILAAVPAAQPGGAQTDRQRFVGTYRLVRTEVRDASGSWSTTPGFNSTGYITYSDDGYMGVYIMPRGRTPFAAAQPTAAEAQAALRGFTAYYGPFRVDEPGKFVVHERGDGQINPGGLPVLKRYYDFVGNLLVLTPGDNGRTKDQATNRLIWVRQPNAQLSPEAQRFVGFHRLLYTERYGVKDGREYPVTGKTDARAGSVAIFTPTGHMMAHLREKDGRTRYAGTTPTPEEALAAFRSYGGYFARFSLVEGSSPAYLIHHQEGTISPGREGDVQRFYLFTDNVLRLGTPLVTSNGETTASRLYWQRMPPLK